MPRFRGTEEGTASLVGRLLILIASGQETSGSLAGKLGISPRQVNRYVNQLREAGWEIERHGARRHGDVRIELRSPRIILPSQDQEPTTGTGRYGAKGPVSSSTSAT